MYGIGVYMSLFENEKKKEKKKKKKNREKGKREKKGINNRSRMKEKLCSFILANKRAAVGTNKRRK